MPSGTQKNKHGLGEKNTTHTHTHPHTHTHTQPVRTQRPPGLQLIIVAN